MTTNWIYCMMSGELPNFSSIFSFTFLHFFFEITIDLFPRYRVSKRWILRKVWKSLLFQILYITNQHHLFLKVRQECCPYIFKIAQPFQSHNKGLLLGLARSRNTLEKLSDFVFIRVTLSPLFNFWTYFKVIMWTTTIFPDDRLKKHIKDSTQ